MLSYRHAFLAEALPWLAHHLALDDHASHTLEYQLP
jgi:hypothetical protein